MHYEDSPVPAPQPVRSIPWKAYIDQTSILRIPEGLDTYGVGDTHIYMAQLCSKIREISRVLYACPEISLATAHQSNPSTRYIGPQAPLADADFFAISMTQKLRCWYDCLPPQLKVDASFDKDKPALPAVLILQ